jgi:hypothetical protein
MRGPRQVEGRAWWGYVRRAAVALLVLSAFGAAGSTPTSLASPAKKPKPPGKSKSQVSTSGATSDSGAITITSGGVYSGSWTSAGATPAVRIATTQPVTITNARITNLGGGELVRADPAASVTITRTTFEGGNGRAFYSSGVKSLTLANCTITKTSGIRLDGATAGAAISISRNRVRNIQGASYNTQFTQLADVTTARVEISWNEVINVFGQSGVEDNINLYRSAYADVHDNYIQGAYPATASGGFSGSGIMIDSLGSHDNDVHGNQVVDTTNAGIGVTGGWDNKIHDNRLVFDGRLDDGTPLSAANVGLFVWKGIYNDPGWDNNDAYANTVGWVNAAQARNDWWLPNCSGNCTSLHYDGSLDHGAEQAEYQAWLAKLAANSVKIGA